MTSNSEVQAWLDRYKTLLHAEKRESQHFKQARLQTPWLDSALAGGSISQSERPLADVRQACLAAVWQIRAKIGQLQDQLDDTLPGQAYVQNLAELISSIQQDISRSKQQQRQSYTALVTEEQQLEKQLAATFDAFESYEAAAAEQSSPFKPSPATAAGRPASAPGKAARPSSAPRCRPGGSSCSAAGGGSSLLPEVVQFDEFVAAHGRTGGWPEEEHARFLSLLRRVKGDYTHLVLLAEEELPCYTREQVIAHARWHADYTDLDMRKRVALVSWREDKERTRRLAAAHAEVLAAGGGPGLRPKTAGGHATSDATTPGRHDQDQDPAGAVQRQMKRAMVDAWKASKAAAAEQQRQQQAAAAAAAAAEEKRQREERQATNKAMLQERAARRKAAQQAAAAQAMQQEGSGLSAGSNGMSEEERQRVALRNQLAAARKHALLAAKQAASQQRQEAQEALLAAARAKQAPVVRDPQRLLSATAAARARAEASREQERGQASSGFILNVSHRATPSWMQL